MIQAGPPALLMRRPDWLTSPSALSVVHDTLSAPAPGVTRNSLAGSQGGGKDTRQFASIFFPARDRRGGPCPGFWCTACFVDFVFNRLRPLKMAGVRRGHS